MFFDQVQITVQAGRGGNGCDSYYRRTDRKVVPHGGDGGSGGSVILGVFKFKHKLAAEPGGHGGSTKKRGKNGEDLVVIVPVGTRIFDREHHFLIRELREAGEEVIVAQGGRGGGGNQGGKEASKGEEGHKLELELTVTLKADIFMIGLPNSGKSKLLNKLTRAHAKEEHYPFATTEPSIGVWTHSYEDPITFCELPSIYEGSHEGRGLGSSFLKHLEGAKLMAFVLDPLSEFAPTLKEGLKILRKQVEIFNEEFLNIPYFVAVNKMDLPEAQEKVKKEKFAPKVPVFRISALTGEGLDKMIAHIQKQRDDIHAR
jgi:GTPase